MNNDNLKEFSYHVELLDGTDMGCYYIKAESKEKAFEVIRKKFPTACINGGWELKPDTYNLTPITVYVLPIHQVSDCEDLGIQTRVFNHREKAIAALKEFRDDEIKTAEKRGFDIYRDTKTHFEIYENGRYCENHSIATIEMLDTE